MADVLNTIYNNSNYTNRDFKIFHTSICIPTQTKNTHKTYSEYQLRTRLSWTKEISMNDYYYFINKILHLCYLILTLTWNENYE